MIQIKLQCIFTNVYGTMVIHINFSLISKRTNIDQSHWCLQGLLEQHQLVDLFYFYFSFLCCFRYFFFLIHEIFRFIREWDNQNKKLNNQQPYMNDLKKMNVHSPLIAVGEYSFNCNGVFTVYSFFYLFE